jgi:transcriptional regulator with XRE-family HTH domain
MHIPQRLRRDPHTDRKGMPFPPQVVRGMRALGRSIRAARLRAGLRQVDLERRSGLDQTVISRIENGKLDSLAWWRLASLIGALGDAWDPPRLERNAAGGWELPADLRASLLLFLERDVSEDDLQPQR